MCLSGAIWAREGQWMFSMIRVHKDRTLSVCIVDGIYGNEAWLRQATALADWGCVSNTGMVEERDSAAEKKCNYTTLGTMKQVML